MNIKIMNTPCTRFTIRFRPFQRGLHRTPTFVRITAALFKYDVIPDMGIPFSKSPNTSRTYKGCFAYIIPAIIQLLLCIFVLRIKFCCKFKDFIGETKQNSKNIWSTIYSFRNQISALWGQRISTVDSVCLDNNEVWKSIGNYIILKMRSYLHYLFHESRN